MAKIKKLSYSDILQVKKLISVVCNDNVMSYRRLFFLSVPITFIQNFLYNVHCRKFAETYVVFDNNNNLKGVISVQAQQGNPYKWQLKRLFLDKSSHEEGKQLVEYIIAKFGARGVDTFYISVDDNMTELIELFVKGCGFRCCSTEALFSVSNINFLQENIDEKNFKHFDNSDAQQVCELYNDTLITHYKYSLSKEKEEFFDTFIRGINSSSKFKYIYKDNKKGSIKAYIEIKTLDNKNYFLSTIVPPQFFELYPIVLSFAVKKIIKRNKNFKLYIRNKKYMQSGEMIENFLKENHFELLQNNAILVRDFFKTIKEENKVFNEAVVFSGFEI
ncbi:hypothetical protein IJ182_04775 [bacterium]|nr:hypothetical protein [bacterium]